MSDAWEIVNPKAPEGGSVLVDATSWPVYEKAGWVKKGSKAKAEEPIPSKSEEPETEQPKKKRMF